MPAELDDIRIFLESQIELGVSELFLDEPMSLAKPVAKAEAIQKQEPFPRQVHKEPLPTHVPFHASVEARSGLLVPENTSNQPRGTEQDLLLVDQSENLEEFHTSLALHPYYRIGVGKPGRIAEGSGPINPPLMLVGASPSEDELRSGAFYSGASAELLRKLLESLGYARNLCYSCWFVKKPLVSPPLPRQVSSLRKMLGKEIELVKPELVLLLGESVFRQVLGTSGNLSDEGGKAFSFAGVRTTAIYDPNQMTAHVSLKALTWKTHLPKSGFFRMPS